MRSGKADVYRPPGGRTERAVAAEVIVLLLEAGVLQRSPSTLARASAAVGVPVSLVRQIWASHGVTTVPLDKTLVASGDDLVPLAKPKPVYAPNYGGNTKAANERARAKKEPVPGKRLCSICGELKPKSQFNVSKPRTGKLRPECRTCTAAYHRERYLSSEERRKLGRVLRFILEEGDEHAGMICPDCRQPCRVGDEVVASQAVLHHAEHHE